MILEIMVFASAMCAVTLLLFDINLPFGSAQAITVAFTAIVMIEMVRAHLVRMKYKVSLFSNKMLLLAIASSIALQLFIIYMPFMQPIFGTTAIGLAEWIEITVACLFLAIVMVVFDKLEKGRSM
jgi:Ca2+-transporting ATPase